MASKTLYLASASPRRRELLDQIGVEYEARPVQVDESRQPREPPPDYVTRLARAKERMSAIVADHLPRTSAAITFSDAYPPLAPTDGNRRLLAQLDQVSRDLGFGAVTGVDPRDAGAADVSFTAGLVDAVLDGLGPKGAAEHTTAESIDLRTLPRQAQRAAVLLYRLSRAPALRSSGSPSGDR